MSFDFGDQEPEAIIATSIGDLAVFEITVGGQRALHKLLAKPIDDVDPLEFVRGVVSQTCFARGSLRDGKYKPTEPALSVADAARLTDSDLESFAEAYITANDYLFRKSVTKTTKGADGKTIVRTERGEVEYPRNENESSSQYLRRLWELEEKTRRETWERTFWPAAEMFKKFTPTLSAGIRNTLSLGASLTRDLEAIRPEPSVFGFSPAPKHYGQELAELSRAAAVRPLSEVESRLDELIEASAKQADFLVKANITQTEIVAELTGSTDATRTATRWNIGLTLVVITLTLAGVALSAYAVRKANSDGEVQRQELRTAVSSVVTQLMRIQNGRGLSYDSLAQTNKRLQTEANQERRQIDSMQLQLDRQNAKLLELEATMKRRAPNE